MFWVISVYFNLRNILPKFGTFLPGHPVYIYIYMCVCVCVCVCARVHILALYVVWFRNYMQSSTVNKVIKVVDFYRCLHGIPGCHV